MRSPLPTASDLLDRHAPLDLSPEAFAEAGHRLVDEVAGLLASMRERPVAADLTADAVRQALDARQDLPEEGTDAAELLARAFHLLAPTSTYNGHPRFFGYITGAPAPAAPDLAGAK